jgi:ATP-dependent protease HslVU (ClpYQ) peptidase subunit
MTTVIATEKEMAGDSKITNMATHFESRKIFRCKNGDILGIAGSVTDAMKFLEWYEDGADRSKDPGFDNSDFEILVIKHDGLFIFDDSLMPIRIDSGMCAIGSGKMAAMAAFYCDKTLTECVRIASLIDDGTGGKIVSMPYDGPLPTVRRATKKSDTTVHRKTVRKS